MNCVDELGSSGKLDMYLALRDGTMVGLCTWAEAMANKREKAA